jgi:hypothetical protein
MDLLQNEASRQRLEAFIDGLVSVIGHADRAVPLHDYCIGLLLPGERKSVEPMAALTAPARTAPHRTETSVAANFCRHRRVVGGGRAEQSASELDLFRSPPGSYEFHIRTHLSGPEVDAPRVALGFSSDFSQRAT